MTSFKSLVESANFRKYGSHVNEAVLTDSEAQWIDQITRQIRAHKNCRSVGVDVLKVYSNVKLHSYLFIGGIVFYIQSIRNRGPNKIFMLLPLTDTVAVKIVPGLFDHDVDHIVHCGKKIAECTSLDRVLSHVTGLKRTGCSATLSTDAGVCSTNYKEEYANSEFLGLFERLLALKNQGGFLSPKASAPETFINLTFWSNAPVDPDY